MKYFGMFIISIFFVQNSIAEFSFSQLYDYVVPQKQLQDTIYQEYDPQSTIRLMVKNHAGNVEVKTTNTKKILVKAIKKSKDAEKLCDLSFTQKIAGSDFIIETDFNTKQIAGSIDFEIVIPQRFAMTIQTDNGDVTIRENQSPARVVINKGSATIINAASMIDVTNKKGAIVFKTPKARIKATAENGDINIYDALDSVTAHVDRGSLKMFAKEVPSTSTIQLSTVSGSINLYLPAEVNADLQAFTKKGTIVCEHFVTLKPLTTKINRQAWRRIQKQIEGTLGTGEAQIILSSVKSDIILHEIKSA